MGSKKENGNIFETLNYDTINSKLLPKFGSGALVLPYDEAKAIVSNKFWEKSNSICSSAILTQPQKTIRYKDIK